MTKIVQEVRGTAAIQATYVGAIGQLTVDYDNWDVLLHDGETPGGHRLINRDNGDERWQAKSVELDGFSFLPEARGMVVRLSAGNYRIRKFVVNTDQLVIENDNGYNGNFTLSIAPRIETDQIFGSDVLIEGVLQVEEGINGDTSGTHYGNVEGNVQGNLTGNSNGTHTGPSNGAHVGDVDVRGHTFLYDEGQINLAALDGLLAYIKLHAEDAGTIKMWHGAVDDIPDGWRLCNGLNGTPDLTDKFIVGAGGVGYEPGDTGGALTHSHGTTLDNSGNHSHVGTVAGHTLLIAELPSHRHLNGVGDTKATSIFNHGGVISAAASSDNVESSGADGTYEGYTTYVGDDDAHDHDFSMADAGTHNHTVNNPSASSLPPYYALCFIMRVIA